ncbi:MAG: tRNA pseudouridine(38-40) synthase TruA [Vulcanimicrobiaceae bacterium]
MLYRPSQSDRTGPDRCSELAGSPGSGREADRAAADGRVTTVRAIVEYDGTNFCGLQYQATVRTVAGDLERVLGKILQHEVRITAAGRTDAGVHATGQVVTFSTPRAFPFERLALATNANLAGDLSVRDVAIVPEDFSARFSAVERTYVYAILNRRMPSALLARYAYHVWGDLDLSQFEAGAAHLLGEHDFRSFCGMLPESGPTLRTVKSLSVERRGDLVRVRISADGFLHRMVRNIVGTLVDCASGRRDPGEIPAMLEARARAAAGHTAPARGLYLAGVRYRDGFDSYAEPWLFA